MFFNKIKILAIFSSVSVVGQESSIKGVVISEYSQQPLSNAVVQVVNSNCKTMSNINGVFLLKGDLPLGEQIVQVSLNGYQQKKFPVIVNHNQTIDIGFVNLKIDSIAEQQFFSTIELDDINNDDNEKFQSQALLHSNRDVFLSSVAFNWSTTFFNIRGLSSKYSKVVLNGVTMNSHLNGKPNWSNWSGLNDLLKNQEFTTYGLNNKNTFGNLIGINELNFDSSNYKKGGKVSFSSTNRSFRTRFMATLHSGMRPNGWSYSMSLSKADAQQGFFQGTETNNFSVAASISRKINDSHKLNITALYTPVNRGKLSPNTQEVIKLKGRKYNSYWGYQNGKKRNSRVKSVNEPILSVSHQWDVNTNFKIQNNALLKIGSTSNSRLEFNGRELSSASTKETPVFIGVSRNPDPSYYQKLPSYFLRANGSEDFEGAYKSRQSFTEFGQLNWLDLYQRNQQTKTAAYVVYSDVNQDTFLAFNSIADFDLSLNANITGKLSYQSLNSRNYAQINDLLGSKGFLDIDGFSEGNKAQSNLRTPNRVVGVGEKFRYNYNLNVKSYKSHFQGNFSLTKCEFFSGVSLGYTHYQRVGKYENGNYPGNRSLGNSKSLNFFDYGFKSGLIYQLNNKLYISSSLNYLVTPPTLNQSFSNPRQNNDIVNRLEKERKVMLDATLNYQYENISARLSSYYINRNDITEVSFFFTENIASLSRTDNSAFVQEIITGGKAVNKGIEFGAKVDVLSGLSVNMSMAYGRHNYANNPDLYITSDSFDAPLSLGKSKLKNYRLANGPQQVYALGFSYRDPTYWWFTTQLNYYLDSFVSISPFIRTQNFATDIDGQPLVNYDPDEAEKLLKQENLGGYFLWNAIGGKSWKTKKGYYFGCILGVQNILNQQFLTGGFEQSRTSNFNDLSEDKRRNTPIFGNKYWQGIGATYYLSGYWRF